MALWPSRAAAVVDAVPPLSPRMVKANTLDSLLGGGTSASAADAWSYTQPISRADAESVPAIARSVDLITSTVAGLPLQRFTATGAPAPLGWLEQPEQDRPRNATFTDLGRDLLFDGRAAIQRDAYGDYAGYIPTTHFQLGPVMDRDRPWLARAGVSLNGVKQGAPLPAGLLVFHGWHDGILRHGARTIRTTLALQGAAKTRADSPLPQTTLVNTSGYELSDAEIDAALAAYRQARTTSAVAYVNSGFDEKHNGWTSVELQMVEALQFMSGQCANLVGVPASYIAGGTGSSSNLTYSNVTQENRQFIDFGLNPLIKALEATLTAADPGHYVRFNLGAMLRGNPSEIADLVATLHPLGLITDVEARAWLDLTPGGPREN